MTTNNRTERGIKRFPLPFIGIVGAIGTSIYILQMFQQQGIAACPPIVIPTIVPSNVQRVAINIPTITVPQVVPGTIQPSPINIPTITVPQVVPSNVQRAPITVQPIAVPPVPGPSPITIPPACR